MPRDLDYEHANIGYDEQYPNGGIKCKNHLLCGAVLPEWWYDCKGHYLCSNCDCMFGKWQGGKGVLPTKQDTECAVCLETGIAINLPNCEHYICINCFKRIWYGDDSGEPEFPYPEIEDQYYDDPDNLKWDMEYPLIKKYNEDWDEWDDARMDKYNSEKHLRCCPLCRK
jgi:hypothetical protein